MHADVQQKWALAQIDASEMRHAVFSSETLRLLAHVLDQLRAKNAFGEAREILDQRGERELSAGFVAFDDQRFQIGARGVEGGRVSGTAGADDDDVASFAHFIFGLFVFDLFYARFLGASFSGAQ
jgi:hypothetical protein